MQRVGELLEKLRVFASEREWGQFHTPKNLAVALSVEASELLEIYQWLDGEQQYSVLNDAQKRVDVEDEIADIFVYLLRFCDVNSLDLFEAVEKKMLKNAAKYPVSKCRGIATKYNEL